MGALCATVKAYKVCSGTDKQSTDSLEIWMKNTQQSENFSGCVNHCFLFWLTDWSLSDHITVSIWVILRKQNNFGFAPAT